MMITTTGQKILENLKKRGWTQSEAAERLGMSRQYLNNLIHGKIKPSPRQAVRLAQLFGIDMAEWEKR